MLQDGGREGIPAGGAWRNKVQNTGTFLDKKTSHVVEAEGSEEHSRRKVGEARTGPIRNPCS